MQNHCITRLLMIMQQLRDRKTGCSWDQEQTFTSLIPHTLDEVYEVVDAIDRQNYDDLRDELGDLLFNIVFYAHLAEENHYFDFDAVCHSVADKLIRRHPHVFAGQASDSFSWEEQKKKERTDKKQLSLLDDIPIALPALLRSEKIQKRCASVGFDWTAVSAVLDKVDEELAELKEELNSSEQNSDRISEELGDLYFTLVNLTRHLDLNAENVVHKANQKFERRFRALENYFTQQGKLVQNASLEELESVWQKVKKQQ